MTQPTLVISEVSALDINLVARTSTDLTVRVSSIGSHNSTLTATVTGTGNVALVTPRKRLDVEVDTPAMFTVTGLGAGNTTTHADGRSSILRFGEYRCYCERISAAGQIKRVNPTLLQFEHRATGLLTVAVIDSTQATITIRSGNADIASVSSQAFTFMGGETNNSTDVVVNGVGIGMTTLTIEASADGYATETATVIVDILNRFRIEAIPDVLTVTEGGGSTKISVSLSRIRADRGTVTVTIMNPLEGSGLTVSSPVLTFSSSLVGTLTVDTTTDNTYKPDRSATLTLTADNYATETVTITILENTPQPVELMVVPTKLSLVRFTSTEIAVSVGVDATLNVERRGAVILVGTQSEYSLTGGAEATQIQIRGEGFGEGTVTFTVSGFRKAMDTVEVSVDVTQPTLVISEVSPSNIKLLTQETTIVTVSVSAIGGHSSTLTATVSDEAGGVVSVTPTEIRDVSVNMPEMFTVKGLNLADDVTIRLTASHPFYDSASTTIDVRVDLRPIELSVSSPELEIVKEMSKELELRVSATEGTTLTVTVDRDGIIKELADEYLLSGEMSTKITVRGNEVGTATLTIRAEAVGYETETTSVSVRVLDILRIVVPPEVDLREDENTQISVGLNVIRDNVTTVTINIAATEGLDVMPSSLMFTNTDPKTVTVRATNDLVYEGDRRATLTLTSQLTADNYVPETIRVDITEDDLQTIGLMLVGTTKRNLVRFASTEITVSVDVATDLMVKTKGAVRLTDEGAVRLADGSISVSSDLGAMESTRIEIRGESVGEGTVTFMVSGARQSTATAVVGVTVTQPTLVIRASTSVLNIAADQTTAELTVTVMAVGGHNSTLTAMVTGIGTGMRNVASVTPTRIVNVRNNTPTIFTVESLATVRGTAMLTLTAEHPFYKQAITRIPVEVTRPVEALRVRIKVFLEGAQ